VYTVGGEQHEDECCGIENADEQKADGQRHFRCTSSAPEMPGRRSGYT